MRKNILVVVSLLSLCSFAYGSAIISTDTPSSKNPIIKTGANSGSSIVSSSFNTKSNITGIYASATDVYKRFIADKANANIALEAFRASIDEGKFRQATNILIDYFMNKQDDSYEFTNYLEKLKMSLSENDTRSADKYALLGGITLNTDNVKQAIPYMLKANELNPQKYLTPLAKLYFIDENMDQAYALFKQQIQRNSSDYDALFYLVQIDFRKGNLKEAKEYSKRILAANKYTKEITPELYFILTSENASDKEIISSLLPKQKGISIEKGYTILVSKMLKQHIYEFAEKMIRSAEKYNSNNIDLYLTAAEGYAENGDYNIAKEYLEKSKKFLDSPEDISRYNLVAASFSGEQLKGARDLALSGKFDDAIKVYEKSKTPDSVETLLGLANSYAGMGDDTKALSYLNKAMTLYPDNAEVYYSFAKYFADKNDIDTANKYINNALRLAPKNPKILSLSKQLKGKRTDELFDEAFSAFDTQNYQETLAILNKISKIEPDNYTVYYYKGLTYGNMNNYSAAISEFMRAKNLNPQFVFVNYLLGIAYDNLGDVQEAKKYYNLYISNEHNITAENTEYINYAKQRLQKL